MLQFENLDLHNVKTPVDVVALEQLLIDSKYDINETRFLVDGFKNGFEIGYEGESKCEYHIP